MRRCAVLLLLLSYFDPRGKQRKLYLSCHCYRYYKKIDEAQRNVGQVTASPCSRLLGNSLSGDLFTRDQIITLFPCTTCECNQVIHSTTGKVIYISVSCCLKNHKLDTIFLNLDTTQLWQQSNHSLQYRFLLLKRLQKTFYINVNFTDLQTVVLKQRRTTGKEGNETWRLLIILNIICIFYLSVI